MMINIAIVDDDEEYLQEIQSIIKKFCYKKNILCNVNAFTCAQLLLYEIDEQKNYDIYFLDIEMSEVNGLELAKKIRKQDRISYIIFITSYIKYSLNAFDYNAYQYIMKSQIKQKLWYTLESIWKRMEEDKREYYTIITQNRYGKILFKDIFYIFKQQKYVIFKTRYNDVTLRDTLKNVYANLDSTEFIYIDKGYIVNIFHIMRLEHNIIFLRNGEELKVSRTYRDSVKEKIHQHWKWK
ncbi:LytR/AlgR family response regulator transcription factor [Blautia pseudococcoides]|uniref:Stage 0 sporulation protein A homolog n=1 Tax=Blautia pseudococcoides TaxID=1796616 RepID=A0A1C7IEZ8_9FIRM|nr:LytTR family DNA-binding domain-containing protein [Blautia pseudococcoides]ANU78237.2 hypothetical protein A4V09_22310 [Blautia pseudococcoides]ASU31048.1 DNA-binding response regulator [Blautia pseudococcoides]QQQ91578.1 response regulator transcription factor [Blautia pseudococcoides]